MLLTLVWVGIASLFLVIAPFQATYSQIAGDELERISWSPDGSKIALAGGSSGCDPERLDDYAVRIFDVATQQIVNRLRGHSCRLIDVAWSPDGTRIVSSGFTASETFIWDATTGSLLVTGKFRVETGVGVFWSPDSTQIASIAGGKYAFIWDATTGEVLYNLPEHTDFTTSVAWSPNGNEIATSSLDGTVQVWNTTIQQSVLTLQHLSPVHWVAWSPDGSKLASAGKNGIVRIWDAVSGEILNTLHGHTDSVEIVDWSSDGARVASSSLDGTIRTWVAESGQLIEIIESKAGAIVDLDWSPVENQLAYIGRNSNTKGEFPELVEPAAQVLTRTSVVTSVAWSPNSSMIAIGYGTGQCVPDRPDLYTIQILNAATNQVIHTLPGGSCSVRALDWSPDGTKLATVSGDEIGTRVWDIITGQIIATEQSYGIGNISVKWDPGGTKLAITDGGGGIIILDALSGEPISVPRYIGTFIDWSPDGNFLLVGNGVTNQAYVLNPGTQEIVTELIGHTGAITGVDWSPNGEKLATASVDESIRIWDAFTGTAYLTFYGHTSFIRNVVWSNDSSKLASGSDDGTVRIWDGVTGQQLRVIHHTHKVFAVAWSPDGTRLAYGGVGGSVEIIEVTEDIPAATPTVGDQDVVSSVAWSPDGSMIAISGGEIGCDSTNIAGFAVRIFDADTGQITKNLLGMTCTSSGVDWSPDSSKLVSFNVAQSIAYIWDVATEQLIMTVPIESQGMLSVVWSPNSDLIASAFPSNGIAIWSSITGEMVGRAGGTTLDWSPDGTKLATGSYYDNLIIIQDHTTEEEIITISGHIDIVYSVAWSPDGTKLASASKDDTARVWSVTSGQLLLTLRIPDVVDARWSPDSQKLATASTEGVVQVWDAITGAELANFSSSTPIYTVDWSPEGTRLAYFDGASGMLQIIPAPEVP